MDRGNPVGAFLRARRERANPEDVGLTTDDRRRVPGLRRREVAKLAAISEDYYVRLEQGRERRPSRSILEALGRVLDFDNIAVAHLQDLSNPASSRYATIRAPERVTESVSQLLDAWPLTPAFVLGRRFDLLAANRMATALHPRFTVGENLVRLVFLDAGAAEPFADWEDVATDAVARLRMAIGPHIHDPLLLDLTRELCANSAPFRRIWDQYDVPTSDAVTQRFHHAQHGPLDLRREHLALRAEGQQIVVYHGADAASKRGLALLHESPPTLHRATCSSRDSNGRSVVTA